MLTIDFKQLNPVYKENYEYLAHISKYYKLSGDREGADGQYFTTWIRRADSSTQPACPTWIRGVTSLGDDLGYDLAYYIETEERQFGFFVHKESQLVRVQCKVAWLSSDGGSLKFNTSTVSMGGAGVWKKKKSGYRGRADWFGVYSPDTGKVYMISVWEAPEASHMILRLLPSKNNQEKNVHWAKDYEL